MKKKLLLNIIPMRTKWCNTVLDYNTYINRTILDLETNKEYIVEDIPVTIGFDDGGNFNVITKVISTSWISVGDVTPEDPKADCILIYPGESFELSADEIECISQEYSDYSNNLKQERVAYWAKEDYKNN